MGPQPRRKLEVGGGYIRYFLVQIVTAGCQHRFRVLSGQRKYHGDIMGGKRPQNVFFASNFAQIQSMRINIINPSQFAGQGNFL